MVDRVDANAEQAEKYCNDAEKKLKGFRLFGNKYEDAIELYEKAGNLFKMGQHWHRAGECFMKCAQFHLQLQVIANSALPRRFERCVGKSAFPERSRFCVGRSQDTKHNPSIMRLRIASKKLRSTTPLLA